MAPETEVSPAVSSGFQRRKTAIIGGLIFLTVVYAICYYPGSKLRPADEYCQGMEENCARPDLFAFQCSSAVMQVYMGMTGIIAWVVSKRAHTALPATPEGRLFGYLEEADQLNAGIFVYQVWDFFASLSIPEHATFVFLAHHALAAMTAWFSLEYQLVHHYAIFFGGVSEFSSIFLVLCDLDKFFPATPGTVYGTFIFVCQVLFTVTFFCFRVVGWWRVSYRLWCDAWPLLRNGTIEKYRPGKAKYFYPFLANDILLGLLQVYWFGLIVQKITEILSGS